MASRAHELFRFTRGDITESYHLAITVDGAEIWRVTYRGDERETSEKLHAFGSPQEALSFVLAMKERFAKEGLF